MSVIRKRYLNNECFAEESLRVKETLGRVQQGHEEYTSETCEHCGQINGKLGGSKTFRCNSCEDGDGSRRERGEEHKKSVNKINTNSLTQIVIGGSGFGLTLGLELLWDTI
ncbi:8174_t:CDS:2 [Funneliformis mosseae]|uniref:8174_t:CDS:1 n=1 Tax=Funneliformis mosseae TaxID=27381 RepID=A0A9N9CQ99_FUNMO|nr:8174_t:CDS:2 [Funneliformis mosseae]